MYVAMYTVTDLNMQRYKTIGSKTAEVARVYPIFIHTFSTTV